MDRLRTSAPIAFRSRGGDRRLETLFACAPRPVGQGDAVAVLRPCRARRRTRGRGYSDVRCRLDGYLFPDGACQSGKGFGVNKRADSADAVATGDFFDRARERLTLEVP